MLTFFVFIKPPRIILLPSFTVTTDDSWRRTRSGGITLEELSEEITCAVSESEGLIFSVMVLLSAISGVISRRTPANTDCTVSFELCVPLVPPAKVSVLVIL